MIEPEFPDDYDHKTVEIERQEAANRAMAVRARLKPLPDSLVDRAYQVLQETPLPADVNRALDIKVIQKDRASMMAGYRFVTFDEMDVEAPAKDWLIKGIFARGETSAWIAPPGAMKSALLAEATVCVAAGLDWHGHRNKDAAGVVYFAIERSDLVKRRLRAHKRLLGLEGTPIAVSSETIDLTHPEAFKKVIDTIRSANAVLSAEIGMIVIDTFAKLIAAGGGDENSAKDQGAVFANLQRVKSVTGVHVALIGHTGKDESRGARGSNALLGDVDVMVSISGDDIKMVTITKANDAPEGPLFSFKSEVHDFGLDEDGDPITVNIVSSEEVSGQVARKPREARLTETQEAMYRLLRDAGAAGLSTEDWNAKARENGLGGRRATLVNVKAQLRDKGLVREYAGTWKVNNA
ncbi:AAA family ATPase [Bradyrhizobium sp. 164]|uniref:AAA family ATPase n=1 Tax=Bradyrhizobium sp. 164 TaxID=2782637 RepID=UPI001FF8FC80|nr:AAA family ATPase [Bradyrhizobium sp. 164]MCK1595489.1 AAA family ATPase [Bradyrhizobium sp. 164]